MMEKLLRKVQDLGWFGGEFRVDIGITSAFEGYSGRASETWEVQYTVKSKGLKSDSGEVKFPVIDMRSRPYEKFDDFIKRVEEKL